MFKLQFIVHKINIQNFNYSNFKRKKPKQLVPIYWKGNLSQNTKIISRSYLLSIFVWHELVKSQMKDNRISCRGVSSKPWGPEVSLTSLSVCVSDSIIGVWLRRKLRIWVLKLDPNSRAKNFKWSSAVDTDRKHCSITNEIMSKAIWTDTKRRWRARSRSPTSARSTQTWRKDILL